MFGSGGESCNNVTLVNYILDRNLHSLKPVGPRTAASCLFLS